MKIGLVGFPGSGKTTVFNALTGLSAETGYAASRGKTHLGVVKVPDARVEALADLFQPKKKTLAEITFSDVAAEAGGGGSARGLDRTVLTARYETSFMPHDATRARRDRGDIRFVLRQEGGEWRIVSLKHSSGRGG